AARLRLVPAPATRLVALLGLPSVTEAVASLPVLRTLSGLTAVEVMLASGLAIVAGHLGSEPPVQAPCVLLVELAGRSEADLLEQLDRATAALGPTLVGSAVAVDEPTARRLWQWRDSHTEAAATLGVVHK